MKASISVCVVRLAAIALVGATLGCGTVFTPPSGPYMELQTILHTFDIDSGVERQDPVSVYTSGSLDPNSPNGGYTATSYGTNPSYSSTKSDSQGILYVSDPVFNAYWRFVWEDTWTGTSCTGQVTNSNV